MDFTDITTALSTVVPAQYQHYIVEVGGFLVTASTICRLVLAKLPPPKPGSWLVWPYKIANFLAVSKGFQQPAYDVGAKAIMTPVDTDRTAASVALGLDPASTHPKTNSVPHSIEPVSGPESVIIPKQ